MPSETKMQKYLFKGHAVALQGSIRKPYFQELGNHLAISTFAGSGGSIKCTSRNFALFEDIRYDSAQTSIDAGGKNGIFHTTVMSQVKGLKIGNNLVTADEVTCRLHSVYDSKDFPVRCFPRILPAGSTIRNLRINGKLMKLDLPDVFKANERTCDAFYRGQRDEDATIQPSVIPAPFYTEGIGTVFYAEWTWVHPQEHHQQRLTMLRLALGSEYGADINVGVASSDGVGWPPTG